MESQDETDPPAWRLLPAGVNRPRRGSASGSPSLGPISSSRDDTSIMNNDRPAVPGTDITPWETSTARKLTESIRASVQKNPKSMSDSDAPQLHTLESTLRETALAIQFHTKWFSEPDMTTLIDAMLEAVMTSTSSAELTSAIKVVETILTYSYIPQPTLGRVVRFVAQTYHGATRAFKTQKMAMSIWDTFEKMLGSHLGDQCISILLDIIRYANEATFTSALDYAQVAGALRLISADLESTSAVPSQLNLAELTYGLSVASAAGPADLCEEVLEVICKILEKDDAVIELEQIFGWDILLQALNLCTTRLPACQYSQRVIDLIFRHLNRFEARHHRCLASMLTSYGYAVHPQLIDEVLRTANFLSDPDASGASRQVITIIKDLSKRGLDIKLLDTFLTTRLPLVLEIYTMDEMTELSSAIRTIINDPSTPQNVTHTLARSTVYLLDTSILQKFTIISELFLLCCDLSTQSSIAAQAILRLRADRDLCLYMKGVQKSRVFAQVSDFAPLRAWTATIKTIIQGDASWSSYTCLLPVLPDLLCNHSLFENTIQTIKELRSIICAQLKTSSFSELPNDGGLTKSDIVKHLLSALMSIISYHTSLTKQELVSTISMFLELSGTRDYAISIDCIHALSVCCYEIPDIMSSYMDDVIDKMAKMVTQKKLAIHVLQFLAGLSRLPELFRNFKPHDFKKIFGVCGSYLHSIRGGSELARQQMAQVNTNGDTSTENNDKMPQYVYALAHHVVCFWYIAIKPLDRKPLKSYITSCLKYKAENGAEIVEDQGIVTIDLMDAMDADAEDSSEPFEFFDTDGRTVTNHRIVGTLLISTETALRNGRSIITVRRSSGRWTRYVISSPGEPHICSSITVDCGPDDQIPIVPVTEKAATFGQILVPSSASVLGSAQVFALEPTAEFERAIQSLDRIPGLDSHKAGILYVGEGQTTETEIIQNSSGSPDFWDFVNSLGEPRSLRGATFNTHGLDRENDMDGPSTIVWENAVTQLVFHIPLLMPKYPESIVDRKKHIGNDAVNVIFNNSGCSFDFDTLPTQVTQAYIIISPSDRTSFLQARQQPDENRPNETRDMFYKVQVITRPGYHSVSPVCDAKIVSGDCLPAFVRNLVLNECIFALMWEHRDDALGGFPSSWRARLMQLSAIRERYARPPSRSRKSS